MIQRSKIHDLPIMIERDAHVRALRRLLFNKPIVTLAGPRAGGKATLARDLAMRWRGGGHVFDLRSPADRRRLEDPSLALAGLRGLVALIEIGRAPHVLPALRELAAQDSNPVRFLLVSSAAPAGMGSLFEPLSRLMARYELPGLAVTELAISRANDLWLRGGLPESFGAASDAASFQWRERYVNDFLERDIYRLSPNPPTALLERFLAMLAQCHSRQWNGSEIARSLGVSHHTARRYLGLLQSAFIVRALEPWRADLRRRQVKSPRIYFRDSGVLHYCLGISSFHDLERHPKSGASWEGFVLENLIQALGQEDVRCFFWAAHTGAAVDLIVEQGSVLRGFQIRRAANPRLTGVMRRALEDLSLARIDVVHPGARSYPLGRRSRAVSVQRLHEEL